MNETDLNSVLERRGQMDAAHGPGCYALKVAIPQHGEQIARYWHRYHDHAPEGFYRRLADAEQVLYVGAAEDVYKRLCEHVAGEVRQATFLKAFAPESLHSIWPKDVAERAGIEETAVARALSGPATRVWTDGELL